MTVHILWWHFPALLTAVWVAVAMWLGLRPGSAWEGLMYGTTMILLALPVLFVWVGAMAWRIAA